MSADTSYDARTGTVVERPRGQHAARGRCRGPGRRRGGGRPWPRRRPVSAPAGCAASPSALEDPATATELVALADRETALGVARLTGELARTAHQLRFYADVAVEGSWLAVTVDHAAGAAPDLRRVRVPLGPVAVLGASNFPFAFGTLGNDTASALAAGCPVIAKAHPAHPADQPAAGRGGARAP